MKYNIIGDIHGRTVWNDLVIDNAVNVFVGDYFDPYDDYSFEEQLTNFLDIIHFAKTYPDTVLLLGNHDLHYFHMDDHSRMNFDHRDEIKDALLDNIHMFNIAYSIQNKILVTHAGVTSEWLEMSEFGGTPSPDRVCTHINNLFWDGYVEVTNDKTTSRHFSNGGGMQFFTFSRCGNTFDIYGTTPTQSPVWIRPQTLVNHNGLEGFVQVVGHTQVHHIEKIPYPIWLVDCLGQNPMSLVVDVDGDKEIMYATNTPNNACYKHT